MAGWGARGKAGSAKPKAVKPAGVAGKLASGLRDADLTYMRDPRSFRRSSFRTVRSAFEAYRKQGLSPTQIFTRRMDPVRLNVQADGKIHVGDGRHRLAWARRKGAKAIRAEVVQYGPRGGVKWKREMVVPLR